MHATLISSLTSYPAQLDALEEALAALANKPPRVTLWLRDKDLPTAELPAQRLRRMAQTYGLKLSWSWCHRAAANRDEALHIPDSNTARKESAVGGLRRILSCHELGMANQLLDATKHDQILLSPWRHSEAKTAQPEELDHSRVFALAQRFPGRVHLVSGLGPSDLDALRGHSLASLCFQTAFKADPLALLQRLTAAS